MTADYFKTGVESTLKTLCISSIPQAMDTVQYSIRIKVPCLSLGHSTSCPEVFYGLHWLLQVNVRLSDTS
jgi:hypothetical protein